VGISITGANPKGSATFSGTPRASRPPTPARDLRNIAWTDLRIELAGTVHENEQWFLKVGTSARPTPH
jgi:hypothetical protein